MNQRWIQTTDWKILFVYSPAYTNVESQVDFETSCNFISVGTIWTVQKPPLIANWFSDMAENQSRHANRVRFHYGQQNDLDLNGFHNRATLNDTLCFMFVWGQD